MKRIIAINFKDGKQIIVEPKMYDFGLLDLGNGLSLNIFKGILYKAKGNVICGEDITDTVSRIEATMQY